MILTCPECATRYFIDDGSIGASGRTVRCSNCATSWLAQPQAAALDMVPPPDETASAAAQVEPEPVSTGPAPGEHLPGLFRAKAEQRRRVRGAIAAGAVWAAIAVVVAAAAGMAIVFRGGVVRAWPKSATAYAAIGLPVNTIGIDIEGVQAQPGLQDGRAAVVVTGALRNVTQKAVLSPALRINLLNKARKAVQAKIAAPDDPMIPAGETRHFTISLLDPPSSATQVEVVFDLSRRVAVPARRASSAAPQPLRPTPPPDPALVQDAKPLSGDSAYALPPSTAEAPGPPPAPTAAPATAHD